MSKSQSISLLDIVGKALSVAFFIYIVAVWFQQGVMPWNAATHLTAALKAHGVQAIAVDVAYWSFAVLCAYRFCRPFFANKKASSWL